VVVDGDIKKGDNLVGYAAFMKPVDHVIYIRLHKRILPHEIVGCV